MVTRKPIAPALDTTASPAALDPPYPTTPTLPTALDRTKTLHSAKSVYSPNLATSPAFDLVEMEAARQQRDGRRGSDVSSHGTWDSEEEGAGETPVEEAEVPRPLRVRGSQQLEAGQGVVGGEQSELPASLKPGYGDGLPRRSLEGQRDGEDGWGGVWAGEQPASGQQAVNNPFRQPNNNAAAPEPSQAAWRAGSPAVPAPPTIAPPPAPPVELPTLRTPAEELSHMSLGEHEAAGWGAEKPFATAESPPVPRQGQVPFAPLVEAPHSEGQGYAVNNPWRTPSQEQNATFPPPPAPSSSPPQAPLQPSLQPLQQQQYYPPPGPPPKAPASTSLIDASELPQYPSAQPAPRPEQEQHRLAPSPPTTQPSPSTNPPHRSEHYQIKLITWQSPHCPSPRQSPILTQNANGPCPLLALVNALVLSTPAGLATALTETLRTREQVSLGLLVDAVFDELMSERRVGQSPRVLPDVSELYAFLVQLHGGMNVNPRFVDSNADDSALIAGQEGEDEGNSKALVHTAERSNRAPSTATMAGGFEPTKEMRLYSTFNIPLIHGWIPAPDTAACAAFARSAGTFEDAQNIQFLAPELEAKLLGPAQQQGVGEPAAGLSGPDQQLLHDIRTISAFLQMWPTQLTEYGLRRVGQGLGVGEFAILFRNDHFSTLYREPRRGALMTLVTDAGYSGHEEIVWESLVDVGGAASEMFSGDFRAVSHDFEQEGGDGGGGGRGREGRGGAAGGEGGGSMLHSVPPPFPGPRPESSPSSTRASGAQGSTATAPLLPADSRDPTAAQRSALEQEDHDLALALQLQEEEEDGQRQADQRRRRERELSERFLSTENVGEGPRPPIPPRRSNGGGGGGAANRASILPPTARRSSQQAAPSSAQPRTAPPTSSRLPPTTTTRRSSDPDAPPTYEQSASDRPYRPAGQTGAQPQGGALSAYEALRRQQSSGGGLGGGINSVGGGNGNGSAHAGSVSGRRQSQMGLGGRGQRRSSQLGAAQPMAGGFGHVAPGGGMAGAGQGGGGGRAGVNQAAGVRDAEERCAVM
ncbi:hypothetical protein LTR08_006086 [Meristemomyces frigidus]|nr:hypothetical protein LTR08_006086 [Meristemomyces frigidus]